MATDTNRCPTCRLCPTSSGKCPRCKQQVREPRRIRKQGIKDLGTLKGMAFYTAWDMEFNLSP